MAVRVHELETQWGRDHDYLFAPAASGGLGLDIMRYRLGGSFSSFDPHAAPDAALGGLSLGPAQLGATMVKAFKEMGKAI